MLQRAGLIGDIHCEDRALDLVLRHFRASNLDAVLSVGDIPDGPGDVNRVCSLLIENNVQTVAGNHDRWLLTDSLRELPDATTAPVLTLEHKNWLASLPKTRAFETSMGTALLCHGIGEDDMAVLRFHTIGYSLESNLALQLLLQSKKYRVMLCGHTHEPMVRTIDGLTVINAGTISRADRQVCVIVDFDRRKADFFNILGNKIVPVESLSFP